MIDFITKPVIRQFLTFQDVCSSQIGSRWFWITYQSNPTILKEWSREILLICCERPNMNPRVAWLMYQTTTHFLFQIITKKNGFSSFNLNFFGKPILLDLGKFWYYHSYLNYRYDTRYKIAPGHKTVSILGIMGWFR